MSRARRSRPLFSPGLLLLAALLAPALPGPAPAGAAPAVSPGAAVPDTLVIGIKSTPPFTMKNDRGEWTGITMELWRDITRQLGVESRFVETDLEGFFDGVRSGNLDAAVSAVTVTADREAEFDFSHPFYTTGLGIAVRSEPGAGWMRVARGVLSVAFLKVLGGLVLLLLAFGVITWLFERRRNPDQFGGGRGIGEGFWWAAVTMTTVGYGDRAPVTVGGRLVALVWMFAGIIVISSFTAAIASSLTVSQLGSSVKGPEDLPHVHVASVPNSTSADYLDSQDVGFRPYDTPLAALQALAEGKVEAVVYDAPLLRYLSRSQIDGGVAVLPETFNRQDYAILLPEGSPLREPINRALLAALHRPEWQTTLRRYLGR